MRVHCTCITFFKHVIVKDLNDHIQMLILFAENVYFRCTYKIILGKLFSLSIHTDLHKLDFVSARF